MYQFLFLIIKVFTIVSLITNLSSLGFMCISLPIFNVTYYYCISEMNIFDFTLTFWTQVKISIKYQETNCRAQQRLLQLNCTNNLPM